MLDVVQVQVEGFDKNFSYLIVDEGTKETLLVDPCGEIERVFSVIEEKNLLVKGALITHTHHDHHDKLGVFQENYDVPIFVHERGDGRLTTKDDTLRLIVIPWKFTLGESELEAYYTPGHHDDCLCYHIDKENAANGIPKLITGDTLFVEGCGRTTEAGVKELYESLQFLKTFPNETEVYTGHDYGSILVSTIEHEKAHNKYFLAKDFDEFKSIRLPQI